MNVFWFLPPHGNSNLPSYSKRYEASGELLPLWCHTLLGEMIANDLLPKRA